MAPPPPVNTAPTGGSGLLQEFRKKVIGKYTSASPTATSGMSPRHASAPPVADQHVARRGMMLSPRTASTHKPGGGRPGSDLTHRIGRFEEFDALLQQLEIQLSDMLTQLNSACRAMGGVVEVFTQTFRYDAAHYKLGVDYLSAMKQMRRERAHLMEQALRFTVLDPLASRLARHAALQERIAAWRQLEREAEKEETKKWSDASARDARFASLHAQLDEMERELGEALDAATNATAVNQQVDLFTTMRLQLATFFYHTNHSLFSRLSETEAEIVIGVGPSPRSPVAGAIATTIRPAQHVEELSPEDERSGHEATLTASGSLDEPETSRGSITLEEFEQGIRMPQSAEAADAVASHDHQPHQTAQTVPVPELLALASNPVVDALRHDEDADNDKRGRRGRPHAVVTSNNSDSSVFSALRKTFNDKFSSPKASSDRALAVTASPLMSPTTLSPLPQPTRRRVAVTQQEWARVETTLWTMDTAHQTACDKAPDEVNPTLASILQEPAVLYSLGGFLCFPSIARLSKTNRHLHNQLRSCAAVWKRSIRLGGLTRTTRSAVWLSVLYGGTPWLMPTGLACVPHHLQSREQRKKIYEGLLVKLGTRIADGLLQKSFDEDSEDVDTARLVVWLREIDVDVVRTCSRAIYATHPTSATPAEALGSYRALLEATIRRVLRAYVMYNPRVGYCQGMNFLVRLLMEVCCGEADEADCFWLFVGLCEPENDRNLYEPGLAVLQPLFLRFEEMLATHKPLLHAHLERECVPVAAYTARWFLTFFSACETFDASVVIRVLDAFAIDGWRVIFGMALVVLDELEPQLMRLEMEEILRVLQSPRDRLGDRDWTEQIVRRGLAYSLPRPVVGTTQNTE